jgi:hypothetical protein
VCLCKVIHVDEEPLGTSTLRSPKTGVDALRRAELPYDKLASTRPFAPFPYTLGPPLPRPPGSREVYFSNQNLTDVLSQPQRYRAPLRSYPLIRHS